MFHYFNNYTNLDLNNYYSFNLYFIIVFISIFCGYMILFFNNPVFSILYLIIVLFCSSLILMVINVNFLALLILIIYLGALIVLFLFVVMMLNIKFLELNRSINFMPFLFIILSLYFYFYIEYFFGFENNNISFNFIFQISYHDWLMKFFYLNNFYVFSLIFYYYQFVEIIIISIILFIAMVGSIILTLNNDKFSKKQLFYKQNIIENNIKVKK